MGIMTIDGRKVEFTDEKNVLSVIRNAGINIPTLCYHSEVSTFGACRLCTVEDDRGRTFASCSEEPRDGMVIYTNSGKVKKYRKLIVELLLAAHCRDCTTCVKSGECNLQLLAHRLGVMNVRFENTRELQEIDDSSPAIIRDPNKCILCGDCVRACEELQGIGALGFAFRGTDAMVMPAFHKKIAETECVGCGQCRVFCPTGAISIHTNMNPVWDALADPEVRVIAQVAPAVRVALGDNYGLTKGRSVMGKIVNVLHRMGFDEVYDTTFSADLTVMEESAEFLNRVQAGIKLPLMTSCCPAWVKYVTDQYPEYKENLSTCRSPQGMMSAVTKEWYRDPKNAGGKKTVMVSFMPCTAKKMEVKRPNSFTKGEQDTDYVITTTELIRMINNSGIDFAALEPEASDVPFGFGSGGGVLFGVTGGVTEAVLRRLIPEHDKAALEAIAECGVRGDEPIKEFTINYEGTDLNICVVSGLSHAHEVMEKVKSGEANYHLIEVMACRRGCIMGGGQPPRAGVRTKTARARGIYSADNMSIIKKPDENPMVQSLYEGFLKGKTHELLHNDSY
ncbi:MAG: 2Fe-2S iron-sulfur cluster binding domain-containing protein [Clostridia bacterium]|nr:2Fe-2S iron-sulfur cluster binding domain-containing protein [Clostridia bacterium]NCC44271.1 2Fe-2S iron-sulfur cluster binding domain-containing protein [Clostridia bacterium]